MLSPDPGLCLREGGAGRAPACGYSFQQREVLFTLLPFTPQRLAHERPAGAGRPPRRVGGKVEKVDP